MSANAALLLQSSSARHCTLDSRVTRDMLKQSQTDCCETYQAHAESALLACSYTSPIAVVHDIVARLGHLPLSAPCMGHVLFTLLFGFVLPTVFMAWMAFIFYRRLGWVYVE